MLNSYILLLLKERKTIWKNQKLQLGSDMFRNTRCCFYSYPLALHSSRNIWQFAPHPKRTLRRNSRKDSIVSSASLPCVPQQGIIVSNHEEIQVTLSTTPSYKHASVEMEAKKNPTNFCSSSPKARPNLCYRKKLGSKKKWLHPYNKKVWRVVAFYSSLVLFLKRWLRKQRWIKGCLDVKASQPFLSAEVSMQETLWTIMNVCHPSGGKNT